jgi:hypothetical protein
MNCPTCGVELVDGAGCPTCEPERFARPAPLQPVSRPSVVYYGEPAEPVRHQAPPLVIVNPPGRHGFGAVKTFLVLLIVGAIATAGLYFAVNGFNVRVNVGGGKRGDAEVVLDRVESYAEKAAQHAKKLSEQQRRYLPYVVVREFKGVPASYNFSRGTAYTVSGRIENTGDRTLEDVTIAIQLVGGDGKVFHESRQRLGGPLNMRPGHVRDFSFEVPYAGPGKVVSYGVAPAGVWFEGDRPFGF